MTDYKNTSIIMYYQEVILMNAKLIIGIIVVLSLCFTVSAEYDRWSELFTNTVKYYFRARKDHQLGKFISKVKARLRLYRWIRKYRFIIIGVLLCFTVSSLYITFYWIRTTLYPFLLQLNIWSADTIIPMVFAISMK